jgi:hypothetical protein
MRSSTLYDSSLPAQAAHVPPSHFSTALVDKHSFSAAHSGLTTTGNSSMALYDLPAAVLPRASFTVPSGDKPGHVPSPDALCWGSIGGLNELGGVSIAETFIAEESVKRPAKRPSSDPEGDFSNKRVCYGEWSESNEAAELLAAWSSVARHDQALDGVVNASLDMSYSSPTTVEEWDENDHLVTFRHLREEVGPVPGVPRDMAHLEFLWPVALSPHEPDSKPPAQSLTSPSSPVARGTPMSVNSSSPAIFAGSPLQEEKMTFSSSEMQSLLSKKLANLDHALNDQENIALLTHCVAEGERNAEKIKGRDVLVVMGNKGAGKSTFLNYLLGCEMIQKTPRELGIAGVSKVVVVKAKSEGGCLDEVMAIGHAEVPKTVIPQIEIDHVDATVAYCDCPGFLDDRGAAINIASVVNIRRVLQSARSTKVLILINYHSVSSDRGQGLHDMLKICTKLFGNSSQLSHHKDSVLLGITRVPSDEANLSDLREWLLENTSGVLPLLYDNLFLYDPLDSGLGDYLSRSACIEALSKLKSIPQSASSRLFQTVLTDSDECELVKIVESQSANLRNLLDGGYYAQAASRWRALEQLRAIDNIRVERLLHMSESCLRSSFSKLEIAFKEACFCNFPRSEVLLNTLSQIARCFSEELCAFSLSTLQDCHSKSRERHAERERRSDKEKQTLEHEYAEKLLTARKEKEALEQAYQELLRDQRTSQQASQSSLTSRIAELSGRQAEELLLQSLCAPAMAFGVEEWQKYYGEVGPAPDLPSDIDDILDSECPFWLGRKIRDTHLLVLIPATVDGVPFTLNLLKELIERPKNGGHKTQYNYYDSLVQAQLGAASPRASYWLLMTRNVLPKSRNKTYADQRRLVADYASQTDLPYELPKTLETATAILAHHVRDGERLYGDSPWTWTCCQELMLLPSGGEWPVVVGNFGCSGLYVQNPCTYVGGHSRGVAGCRKFCVEKNLEPLAMAFGAKEWKHYFGEVEPAPDLPRNMVTILDSTCPFWPGRKVRDTHLLVLIPAKVNGQLFSLNLLRELIQRPKNGGYRTQYRCYDGDVQAQLGATSPTVSYWLLMTRDVLPESCDKTYAGQEKLIADHARRTSLSYELPKVLEAATAILIHHVRDGERLYGDNPWTWTCCQEWVFLPSKSNEYPAVVGGFESSGLAVYNDSYDSRYISGAAGCRRFYVEENAKPLATAFGAKEWRQYFGEVEEAPALPGDIEATLDAPCPFWNDKKVRDTHLLVLIPAKVNGRSFSLNLLRELIQHPNNGGHKARYRCYDSDVRAQLGATSPTASYWLLITRDVLPESRRKKYADQKKLVTAHASRVGLPYELPKALEAAAAILAHHVRDGERLYGDNPWTYTCCQERVFHGSSEYPAVVGGFESSGLFVYYFCTYGGDYDGAAGCRKF